jgi:predicted secreted hydrolase
LRLRSKLALVALVLFVSSLLVACEQGVSAADADKARRENSSNSAGNSVRGPTAGLLSGDADARFARALAVRTLQFPADHGPHANFRTEWWYFTGNLLAEGGRRFGFQLTLFRRALAPPSALSSARPSSFATRQAWMGHFALSDVDARTENSSDRADNGSITDGGTDGGRFYAFERLERGAAGLAGARAQPFRVWLRDWQVSGVDAAGSADIFPLHMHAAESGISVDLRLERGKAKVLQGDAGLSRKSAEAGDASYYYSYTRMPATGRVRSVDGEFQVTGLAWLDREWSSSALAADQIGWDWFALQLDDGRELMLYRLRDQHGGTHPYSAAVLIAVDGTKTPLALEQVDFEPVRVWRSPDGEHYPVVWKLRAGTLQLRVSALFDAQAHRGRLRYWEGAVQAQGRDGATLVSATGYLEMTGY